MNHILQLHELDNVGICKISLPGGTQLINTNFLIASDVPTLHKVALRDIATGEAIIKYGQIIGFANQPISAGIHVHTHNCVMGETNKEYGLCNNIQPIAFVSESQRATFQGYLRKNGRAGTRNYLGILTTVNCSATVARAIAHHFTYSGELDAFDNLDGVVALTHETGCGMRSDGEGYETLRRTFDGYARHPNFGGVMMLGLGCETMQVQRVMQESGLAESKTFCAYTIQDTGGTRLSIEKGIARLREMLPLVNAQQRQTISASELIIGLQCGGSDALSGVTANPALGIAGDILIRHGGTVILSETPEIYGAEHLLTQRAATPQVAEDLLARIRWWEEHTARHGVELNNNPSPGNKAGGLTTIMEKSLGAQAKSGSTNLNAVYCYAEPITKKGLVFMDSPGYDPVSATGQIASGAQIICFTTGRGSAFGCKPAPCIKLSSNTPLYERMKEDIDVNCGGVLDGEMTLSQCGEKIFEEILRVASGEPTKSELLGYGDNEFTPWKMDVVL